MAKENFLTYTESDASNRLSETSSRVTFTDLKPNDDNTYLYRDLGVDYFDGDFEHRFAFRLTSLEQWAVLYLWAMTNDLDDYVGLRDGGKSGFFISYSRTLTSLSLRLWELDSGAVAATSGVNFSSQTTYYVKVTRVESEGTYGKIYLRVYSDPEFSSQIGTTFSITLSSSKKDFRYVHPTMSNGELFDGNNGATGGYVENLEGIANTTGSVTAQDVSAIAQTTATGNGTVLDVGTPTATQHGHKWDTNSSPYSSATKTELGVPTIGAFTSNITGLTPYRTYWVVPYITNSFGTSYGIVKSFMTLADSDPSVTTEALTDVTYQSATGNGTVVNAGDFTIEEHGHVWSTLHLPTIDDDSDTTISGALGAYTSSLTSLLVNTVYFVRAYVKTTTDLYFYGNEVELATSANLPIVTTQEVTEIGETEAVGNLTLVNSGGSTITQYGVVYDTSTHADPGDVLPTNSAYTAFTEEGATSIMQAYTSDITTLLPSTLYYLRAYATNGTGTTYGDEVSFTTRTPGTPIVTTGQTQFVERTTAQGQGTLVDIGSSAVTEHGHCWGTSANPDTTDSKTTLGALTPSSFESDITGLIAGTTYYTRAYATNTQGTSYGDNDIFVAQSGSFPYPSNRLARVTGIKRTFYAGSPGVYLVELFHGGLSTSFTSPIGNREPAPSVPQTPVPIVSGQGFMLNDMIRWLSTQSPQNLLRIFGHLPISYKEWKEYMEGGGR